MVFARTPSSPITAPRSLQGDHPLVWIPYPAKTAWTAPHSPRRASRYSPPSLAGALAHRRPRFRGERHYPLPPALYLEARQCLIDDEGDALHGIAGLVLAGALAEHDEVVASLDTLTIPIKHDSSIAEVLLVRARLVSDADVGGKTLRDAVL